MYMFYIADPSEDFFEITQSDFNKMYASVVAQQ